MNKLIQKVVIVSDSHSHHELLDLIKDWEAKIDTCELLYIHAGDSCARYEDQLDGWLSVKGNMDYLDSLPFYRIIPLYKHKLFMTHGHLYNMNTINQIMKENDCDICVTGHTHVPSNQVINGKYYLNPGSIVRPRFMSSKQYILLYIYEDGSMKIKNKLIEEIM